MQVIQDDDGKQGLNQEIPLSQSSEMEEYCPRTNDLFVAFDKKTNELVTNTKIYSEYDVQRAMEDLTFTSHVSQELKEIFDDKFSAYRNSLSEMNKIAPKVISQTLETTVNRFFESVDHQIKYVETSVLEKIQSSTNLKELEELLNQEKGTFGLDLEKIYEQNRIEIENCVQKGSYSAVVQKKDHYENLIRQMNNQNEKM